MRNLGLDLLRLVALMLVLGRHLYFIPENNPFFHYWFKGGWIGVDLFFVLSGFLVSGILYQEYKNTNKVDIKRFLIRRGFKIYPAFYFLIPCTIIANICVGKTNPPWDVAGELFFMQPYWGGLWIQTWTLGVEEHFYLAIALYFGILLSRKSLSEGGKNPFSQIPLAFAVTASVCLGLRIMYLLKGRTISDGANWAVFFTHTRIDSLMFGAFISYFWHFKSLKERLDKWSAPVIVLAGIALLLPGFLLHYEESYFTPSIGLTFLYCGAGLLILASTRLAESRNRILVFLGKLGTTSYCAYLWHMAFNVFAKATARKLSSEANFTPYFTIYFCIYIFGTLAFGWFMTKILEAPMLRLRDRLFPSASSAKATGHVARG